MPYTLDIGLALGTSKSGLTDLRAQLVDTGGSDVGAAISTGFTDMGQGFYLWHYASFPDAHRGGVKFYSNASPSATLAFVAINPEEAENTDAKISAVKSKTDSLTFAGGLVAADAQAISGDTVAADNLEAALDGTGGVKLTLRQLVVTASANESALELTGSGTGDGIRAQGGAQGRGAYLRGGSTSGAGLKAEALGTAHRGVEAIGGVNGHGLYAEGNGTGSGILAGAVDSGFGLYALGGANSGAGAVFQGRGPGSEDHGLRALSASGKSVRAPSGIHGNLEGSVQSVAADGITASSLSSDAGQELADALLDRSSGVEAGLTLRQALRLVVAACAGKLSGASTTTITIRNVGDTKDRIVATVDVDGNRTSVVYDVS